MLTYDQDAEEARNDARWEDAARVFGGITDQLALQAADLRQLGDHFGGRWGETISLLEQSLDALSVAAGMGLDQLTPLSDALSHSLAELEPITAASIAAENTSKLRNKL